MGKKYMPSENSLKNLRPMNTRSKEERVELAKRGAAKSAEVRKKRRSIKQELDILLSSGDVQERLCLAMLNAAIEEKNVRAATWVRDTSGEVPAAKLQADVTARRLDVEDVEALTEGQRSMLNGVLIDNAGGRISDLLTLDAQQKLLDDFLE